MDPQEYLISTLESLQTPIKAESIGKTPLEEAIFAKVMSKKFRKLKADEETIKVTRRAIHTAVSTGQPVIISFLFGGYKLWRFDEAPEIDWAEIFAVTYFVRWLKTIAAVYPPGVTLDFYSEDIAVETLNNIARNETERYSQTFKAMLDWIRPYVPQNVNLSYRRYGDEYNTYADYLRELDAGKARILRQNHGKLPTLNDAQKAATELNVRLLPGQDSDPLWREKVEVVHKGVEATDTMSRYLNDPSLIMACPTKYSGWVAVGSTKRSYAKFWAGVGALQRAGSSFNELVLTPNQLKTTEFEWAPIKLDGLKGKSFSQLRILK